MLKVLRQRQFLFLWLSEGLSVFGDQFQMIALPWLVLQITGDGFAMGTVLAMAGVPRALLMLAGGAMVDRFSPRQVMFVSLILRSIFVFGLAVLIISGQAVLWMLYILALVFGIADAFYYPAETSIVTRLVEKSDLQAGNALVQITIQSSVFTGPLLAGLVIAYSTSLVQALSQVMPFLEISSGDHSGIGLAFGMNGLALLMAIFFLIPVKERFSPPENEHTSKENVLKSIWQGLTYMWKDGVLRLFFFILSAINFLFNGPFMVGIPLLADKRLPEGAAAFGMIMSSFGGGSLLGTIAGGTMPKPQGRSMGILLVVIIAVFGTGLFGFGFIDHSLLAAAAMLLMGIANGYANVIIFTWLQQRTPAEMIGRIMSLLMFASVGLVPISEALCGAFGQWNLTALFICPGLMLLLVALWTATRPEVRRMGDEISAPATYN